jgi:predicted RNase H-like HicB family nuclease
VVIIREDDRYVAQCLEVDVSSFGDTQDEALAMITEALELCQAGLTAAEFAALL